MDTARMPTPARNKVAAALGLGLLVMGPVLGQTAPDITSFSVQGNQADLQWTSAGSGIAYDLLFRPALHSGSWSHVFPPDWVPVESTALTFDPGGEQAGFYRVRAMTRGTVENIVPQNSYSALAVNFAIWLSGLDIPFSASYGVDVYQVTYSTLSPRNDPVLASGAVFIPNGTPGSAPLLAFQHGTLILSNEAPSVAGTDSQLIGVVMASDGYVVAEADFLGLGHTADGLHPYLHAKSTATAVIDMLRATRTTVNMLRPGLLNGQLFLAGYSQGGQATMATHMLMETYHAAEFTVTASAPMAGPYDLSGTMAAGLADTSVPYASPYYLPYLLFSYQQVYELYDNVTNALVETYATDLPPLFDGAHGSSAIDAVMPTSGIPAEILQPAYRADFETNAAHPLRAALELNDTFRWVPQAPMRLYHCEGDEVVPFANSQVAFDWFGTNGATHVELVLHGGDTNWYGHGDCALPSAWAAREWFNSLRVP